MLEKKTVSAREVIADIRVGMTDEQLMKKHLLSVKGLQSLKNKLLAAGLLTQVEIDGKTPAGKVATPPVDKKAFARNIASAVKAGMSDAEVLKIFGISGQKLPAVLTSLMKAGYLTQDDLDRRPDGIEQAVDTTLQKVDSDPKPGRSEIATPTPPESTKYVLLDLAKRFNVPREDLERLKTASVKDIKAFVDKHNIPWSDGVELAKALGLQAGEFLSEATDKIKKGAGSLLSAAKDKIESHKGVASKAINAFKSLGHEVTPKSDNTTREEDHTSSQFSEAETQSSVPQHPPKRRAVLKCPNCGMPQTTEFEVCPQCGIIVEKYLQKHHTRDETTVDQAIQTKEAPTRLSRSHLFRRRGYLALTAIVLLFLFFGGLTNWYVSQRIEEKIKAMIQQGIIEKKLPLFTYSEIAVTPLLAKVSLKKVSCDDESREVHTSFEDLEVQFPLLATIRLALTRVPADKQLSMLIPRRVRVSGISITITPTALLFAKYQTKLSGNNLVVKISHTDGTPPTSLWFQLSLADFTLESPTLFREVFSVPDFQEKISIVKTADAEIKADRNSKELSARLNVNTSLFAMDFKGGALIKEEDQRKSVIRVAKLRLSKLSDQLKLNILRIEREIGQPLPREGDDIVLEATGTFENINIKGLNRVLHPYNLK